MRDHGGGGGGQTLESLHEFASGWLRRSLRAVVHAVLKDHALHMELSSQGGGRRLFGLLPATDGVPHELQASKLKVRAKAILDELGVLGGDAPPVLLQSLHLLTSRRINWPRNALYQSERDALHMAGAGGASSISATSPRVLTVGLLITRTLLHRLLLQPEAMLAPKTTPRGMANLRMLAAMLYVLGCAVPLVPLRPELRGKLGRAQAGPGGDDGLQRRARAARGERAAPAAGVGVGGRGLAGPVDADGAAGRAQCGAGRAQTRRSRPKAIL